jgi:D-alanine-D-alanine ligase
MGRLEIALLSGGWSAEREISLKSGDNVIRALDRDRYHVTRYDPRDDLPALVRDREKIDLALILLHGQYGEDGRLQGFLDIMGIPYVGSGVLSSALAMNKKVAKALYKNAGLQVIEDRTRFKGEAFSVDEIMAGLGSPMVIKPVSQGSSVGASISRTREELLQGIDMAFRHDTEVMIERYVRGREVTSCILGNREMEALPLVEIVPNPEFAFFDYRAKYTAGATREICPAPLSENLTREVQECAKKAHRALECKAWSRTDMIIEGDRIYLLETNTIPGMTETSLVPLAARTAGMTFERLLDKLISLSFETKENAKG